MEVVGTGGAGAPLPHTVAIGVGCRGCSEVWALGPICPSEALHGGKGNGPSRVIYRLGLRMGVLEAASGLSVRHSPCVEASGIAQLLQDNLQLLQLFGASMGEGSGWGFPVWS